MNSQKITFLSQQEVLFSSDLHFPYFICTFYIIQFCSLKIQLKFAQIREKQASGILQTLQLYGLPMDENQLFHPINEPQEPKEPLVMHFQKHYKKHLFGLGILFGIALFKTLTVIGSYLGITGITEKTNADYKLSAIEIATQTFDQIEAIARQRDVFFHQEGKIYSYTGETLFHQLDTKFHILDNAYRSAWEVNEKLKIAEKLDLVINQQTALFLSAQDINIDRNMILQELDDTFHTLQKEIQTK